jgi:hypothetical protein
MMVGAKTHSYKIGRNQQGAFVEIVDALSV